MKVAFIPEYMTFVSAGQLAFESPFTGVQPYLFAIPPRFAKYTALWGSLGVPRTFSVDQLLVLLQKIGKVEDDKTMKSVVQVVQHLAAHSLTDAQKYKLLVPTTQGALVHPHTCVFHLDNGLPESIVKGGFHELHATITIEAAKRLGVKSPGAAILGGNKRSIIRQYGQHTNLTDVILKLLNDYPEFSVCFEIVQNADDAGATEIHFIHDTQQHATNHLLADSMKPLQALRDTAQGMPKRAALNPK